MKKYRKKPLIIEAMQLSNGTFNDALRWIGRNCEIPEYNADECCISIETLEGIMDAHEGDYIIRGIKGEFYPCKPDIFEASYEEVLEKSCDHKVRFNMCWICKEKYEGFSEENIINHCRSMGMNDIQIKEILG